MAAGSRTPGKVGEATRNRASDAALFVGAGLVTLVSLVCWGALKMAGGQEVPGFPFAAPIQLLTGELRWPVAATVWVIVLLVAVGAAATAGVLWWRRRRPQRSRVDTAQAHLGNGKDLESITEKAVAGKARSLGVSQTGAPADFSCTIGVFLGRTLSGTPVYASFEDMHLDIWGPRQGKSTSRIIGAICEAPGAVLTTENKRGNLDHTRLVREFRDANGIPTRRVWVFDPQQIANEEPWWFWNPLSYVTDENRAEELAQLFAAGDDGQDAKKDAYFDPEGQDLLANLILASALAGEPITTVYERLVVRARGHEAVAILDEHDYPMIAHALNARLNFSDKQADGIWGTAAKMAKCLRGREVRAWVSRTGPDDDRPELDITDYIRRGETLYCLSREGVGSMGPLVGALTMAVTKTAETIATASPGGRLNPPMLCPLDEAANVVPWPDLPKLYSHFGSRGIIIMTILQSWSQGIGVFGERPMKLLESSSNIYIYGGNVRESAYLDSLVKLTGKYERESRNVSVSSGSGRGNQSVSRHTTLEDIFNIRDVASWPRGRMLLFSAGNPPTIVLPVPWWDKPYAHLIEQSLAEYGPQGDDPTGPRVLDEGDAA
ncbi:TraM recognition domain-containing protein (plasmid) [Gordonia hongkongensis]|uniref:type IV secretory system conjugative DNA transfer family protein n=1 Tax=Gordonia hongkongensis TaxID=1701090 RepID=UPI0030D11969